MRLTAWITRVLGRRALTPILWLVVLYFYATGADARSAIADYQHRLSLHTGRDDLFPTRHAVYRQFMAFAENLLDKLDVWQGKITAADLDIDDPDELHAQMQNGRGQMLVCAHLGNLEICRAMAGLVGNVRLNILVHSQNAMRFNRLLARAGASNLNLIQVNDLDTTTMLSLSQRLEHGEWLAIAGDRTPLRGNRVTTVRFLGSLAELPQGPWLLAGLLRCPVNTLFCTRRQGRFHVAMRRLSDGLTWTRATRQIEIDLLAQRYADALASACTETPLQWFNFYPFWQRHA